MGLLSHLPAGPGKFSYPYEIEQSCRFNSSDTAYLYRTPSGAATDPKTATFSCWIKRAALDGYRTLFGAYVDGTNRESCYTSSSNVLVYGYLDDDDGFGNGTISSASYLRDTAGWMHVMIVFDTANATQVNRGKVYVNGVQRPVGGSCTMAQNSEIYFSDPSATVYVGQSNAGGGEYFDGYMAEAHFVDGQALTPSDFGRSLNGIWVPKAYTGTYGNNGFYLDFSNASDFGEDQSGNGNDFTDSGLNTADQVEDSPTNNYCTLNILNVSDADFVVSDVSNGNLRLEASHTAYANVYASMEVLTGKWYYEARTIDSTNFSNHYVGFRGLTNNTTYGGYAVYSSDGQKNDGSGFSAYGDAWSINDIIGCAFDIETNTAEFFLNNVSQGTFSPVDSFTGSGLIPAFKTATAIGAGFNVNFGQLEFSYTPPAGYKTLCTENLPEPEILEGNKGFDAVTYTGDGSGDRAITGIEHSPDMVWVKSRSAATGHSIADTERGANLMLHPHATSAETSATNYIRSFNTDGFNVGTHVSVNDSGETFVAWCWKKSPKFGIDIVTYTGTGAAQYVSHSLGVKPGMIIIKNRESLTDWVVYHEYLNGGTTPAQYHLHLNETTIEIPDSTQFADTEPRTIDFRVFTNSEVNESGKDHIAYLFASVEGFSKVFSYTGNNAADGPFIYCGFRPRFWMVKRVDTAQNWAIMDSERNTYNVLNKYLLPNLANAEPADLAMADFVSNGIKIWASNTTWNAAGEYVGIAFAEHPFKYANAR